MKRKLNYQTIHEIILHLEGILALYLDCYIRMHIENKINENMLSIAEKILNKYAEIYY